MTIDDFASNIDRTGDGCWPWRLAKMGTGYGELRLSGRTRYAHVVALELALGRSLGLGEWACHDCDNPPCCRVGPGHIYLGNSKTNAADRAKRKRHPWSRGEKVCRGEDVGNSKLTEAKVALIRAKTLSISKAAAFFGVSMTTVKNVRSRKTWKHLPIETA